MKFLLSFTLTCALIIPSHAQFGKTLQDAAAKVNGGGGLSNDEVISGLKEALVKSAESSVQNGSALDGYWKNDLIRIPFPPEAEKMKSTLNNIGMTAQVEEFEMTMNRAAEEAAKEALPVLKHAVKNMSVSDGFAILKGGDNAATEFLREGTSVELMSRFRPIVEVATDKVDLTAYWTPLAKGYNKATMLTGGQAVEPDLNAYVTQKAIDGLFTLIAQEEAKIRQDPMARTSDLLQRVFGKQN